MRSWHLYIFGGALALRLATLGVESIWYDEAFTAAMTRLPLPDMIAATMGDVHPPLWYMVTAAFTAVLGDSPFVLRLPAALASALAAGQGYELLRGMSGEKSGRLAGVLLAVLPGQLNYGQEARMYALLVLLMLVAVRLALSGRWLALGVALAAMNWTHNLAPVYTALLAGWALVAGRGRALPGLGLAGLLTLPWLAPAIEQARHVGAGFWLASPSSVGSVLYWLYFTTLFNRLPEWAAIGGFIVSTAVTLVSVYHAARQWRRVWLLALLGFAPPAILAGVSLIWRPVMLDRALVPSGAAVIGLWAVGLPMLSAPLRRVFAVFAAPTAALALVGYYALSCSGNCFPVPQPVTAYWRDGDAIYHISITSVLVTDYYLPDHPAYIMPEAGDLAQSLSDVSKQHMGLLARQQYVPVLAARGVRRLWVLYDDSPMTSDQERETFAYLLTRYPVVGQWWYRGSMLDTVILVLLDLSGSGLAGSLPLAPRWCVGGRWRCGP